MFGRTNKIATYNPHVVLDVCGSKLSASAVIGGGSKCRWSGEHGRALVLFVSYADLTAAGWGQAPWQSPKLRVEMWDQISPIRTTDTFTSSTDISLKDILGIGATWIDISRDIINTIGRVKVHVESPDLDHSVSLDRYGHISEGRNREYLRATWNRKLVGGLLICEAIVLEEIGRTRLKWFQPRETGRERSKPLPSPPLAKELEIGG